MCGLAGFVTFQPFPNVERAEANLKAMNRAIAHRGPDAEGYWIDQGVALGHRRLSILDLSPAGAQPMHSSCGRFVLAFNGEIYNHVALRQELEGTCCQPAWRGHSDTETLLAAIATWGLERTLRKAAGMFAIAIWDRKKRVLSLARDRMGEKPLYFARQDDTWMFGSELRALTAGGLTKQIDKAALAAYLRFGYVPDHLCIFRGVAKVMPGSLLHLRANTDPKIVRYDHLEARFEQSANITNQSEALSRLRQVLEEVVSDQMESDVPLGCFLSGGIDSSLVASFMQAASSQKIRSFSIGFDNEHFNEAPHAAAVAKHLGTDHTEFILKEEDALAIVADLPCIYDEPFADSSQIPTTLLCRAAREQVTVALSGDGGDEVFGGYNRHVRGPDLWARVTKTPWILRQIGAHTIDGLAWLALQSEAVSQKVVTTFGMPLTTIQNLPKLAKTLRAAGDAEDFYRTFVSTDLNLKSVVLGLSPENVTDPRILDPTGLEMAKWIMACDATGYLPGDILVKVDRAAMSVGLETRAPLLDARVDALARRIPIQLHVDRHNGKKLLRALLYQHVPRRLIDRPKQGFAIPLDEWLRGALMKWAKDLLDDQKLATALGLDIGFANRLLVRHQNRHISAGRELWTILMLFQWARFHELGD